MIVIVVQVDKVQCSDQNFLSVRRLKNSGRPPTADFYFFQMSIPFIDHPALKAFPEYPFPPPNGR